MTLQKHQDMQKVIEILIKFFKIFKKKELKHLKNIRSDVEFKKFPSKKHSSVS